MIHKKFRWYLVLMSVDIKRPIMLIGGLMGTSGGRKHCVVSEILTFSVSRNELSQIRNASADSSFPRYRRVGAPVSLHSFDNRAIAKIPICRFLQIYSLNRTGLQHDHSVIARYTRINGKSQLPKQRCRPRCWTSATDCCRRKLKSQ